MEHFGKEKSKTKGTFIVVIAMIIVPLLIYWVVDWAIGLHAQHSVYLNDATSRALGFGLGTVFHLSLIVTGVLKDAFNVVKERVIEFFENLVVSLWFAIKCYWESIFTDGISLWLYLAVMVACAWLSYDGFRDALAIISR